MKIGVPSAEVIAYSQLVPLPVSSGTTKVIPYDPCSELARITEIAGRTSWKSEDKASVGSADGFCTRVVHVRKDQSIAEHASVTMRLVTDRYASHQIVRHRLAAYTQESTHYINYSKKGDELTFMEPLGIPKYVNGSAFRNRPCSVCSAGDTKLEHHDHEERWTEEYRVWRKTCEVCETSYYNLLSKGVKHYHARFVLPGCLKTEVVATYNLRMWLHVLKERTPPSNTPEIAHVMRLAAGQMRKLCPEIFEGHFDDNNVWKEAK